MERRTTTKEWVNAKELDMESVVKISLSKGGTVTITPNERDTYHITASFPETDAYYTERIRNEITKTSKLIDECDKHNQDYERSIVHIEKNKRINKTLLNKFTVRNKRAYALLNAMDKKY